MRAAAVAKIILVAAGVVAALYFLYLIRSVIQLVVIALFVAVALGPAVDEMERRRLPRGLAILICYVVLFLAVFGVGLLVVPPIVSEVDDFARAVPGYVDDIRRSATLREYDDRYGITEQLRRQAETLPSRLGDAVSALQAVTVGVFSATFQLITILVVAFFLLLDGRRIVGFTVRELGPVRGPRWQGIAENVYRAVGGYVVGMAIIAAIAGTLAYLVMLLVGIEFAVPLAVLMAFFVLIPLIGATIASAVIALVALLHDFPTDLIVWVVYAVLYQQFENNVLQPQIMRRTVQLRPLVAIVAVLIGATLLGVLGALLAIPIAAALQIVVKDYWDSRHDRLLPDGQPPVDVVETPPGTEGVTAPAAAPGPRPGVR